MAQRMAKWWIPATSFLVALIMAIFAGPSLGASSRSMMSYTGKRYRCTKYCDPGGPPCETKESDSPISGWECTEINPVNFLTGANFFSQQDLGTKGLSGFGVTRMYLQDPTWADNAMGPGWRIGWMYRIIPNQQQLWIIGGNSPITSFTDNGNGTYSADFDYVQTLVADTVNHLLVLTDSKGKQWKFFDFSASWNAARQGRLKEFDDRGGNITTTIYGTSGVTLDKLLEVQQTDTNPNLLHRFDFSYNLSGASIGLLASATYSQTNTGVTKTVRVANYTYYTSTTINGPAGTLRKVVITDGTSALDTSYYRYNAVDASGWAPLRYAVLPKAYARLIAALTLSLGHAPSDAEVDAALDSTVATYTDYFFVYDTSRRVTQETVQGQGCGCGSSGSKGIFGYAYASSSSLTPDGPNVWRNKNTVTLPDGNMRFVYTNSVGQTMLDVFKDSTSGFQWIKYFLFNSDGSLASITYPSGVTGYTEGTDGLVSSAQLPDAAGLWELFDYYSTTNLGTGAVAKYVQDKKIKNGELATPILQESYTFGSRSGSSGTIYPLASRTQYHNTDGTGAQLMTFAYTWQGTTTQIATMTMTYPTVSAAQNGSAAPTSTVATLDAFGRQTSAQDEDGFVHTTAYDTLTGAATQRVGDTNNLHLVTTMVVDLLGRTTKLTDPGGNITYTVYNDPQYQIRVYPGWTGTATTGPTQMVRQDRPGSYTERLTMSAVPHVTSGAPDGTEAVSALQSLSRDYIDTGSRVVNTDSYFDFSSGGFAYSTAVNIGTLGTNYYRRLYNYDTKGRRDRDVDWTGTISRTFYDSRDRVQSTWIGTNDTPASGNWSPTNNTAPSNMIQVSQNFYDSPRTPGLTDVSGVGDGTFTHSCLLTSASTVLESFYTYDFRSRQIQVQSPDPIVTVSTWDNLDHVTQVQTYAGSVATANLRAQSGTAYDDKGQVYQSTVFQVNCDTDNPAGQALDSRTTNFWSNARGLRVKTRGPNGEFIKVSYDGAGRRTASFLCFDDSETNIDYNSALTVGTGLAGSDTVVEQTVYAYDADANGIQTTSYQRTPSSAKTGDLSVNWSAADSRRKYAAQWYDAANRPTASADYGTNGGVALSRPTSPPPLPTGDTISYILTLYGYDTGGRQNLVTDNKSRVTFTVFDGLGRISKIFENGTADPTETMLDTNRKTELVYDSVGNLYQRKASNPKGSGLGVEVQITRYVYGTTANQGSPAVKRNDVLVAEIYPDSDDTGGNGAALGNGLDGTYDRVEYTYDYASRRSTKKDQRGIVHTYSYDSSGRYSADSVTGLPANVDASVQRIGVSYDTFSRRKLLTSYSDAAGTTVFNQVQYKYGNLGTAIQRYDSHVGAVVTGTTPSVQVAYTDGGPGTVGGVGKYVRVASTTYPNTRQVFFNYPAAGGTSVGDHLSRIDNIAQDGVGTTQFAQYSYMGSGRILDVAHPQVTNGLVYRQGPDNNPGGWDQFDRQIMTKWRNTAVTSTHDEWNYSYDSVSNRLTRQNAASTAPATPNDDFYTYDGLRRLTEVNRGKLTGSPLTISDANRNYGQNWNALESQGNWRGFRVAPTGGSSYSFVQTRSHNSANEIDVDNNDILPPGVSISNSWIAPTYDKSGNTTTSPVPGAETTGYFYTYDAWNRLVKVQNGTRAAPGTEVVEFQYDAENWRTGKLVPSGTNWNRTDYYYNLQWQCVEERTQAGVTGKVTVATVPSFQWVWDLKYVDAVLFRDVVPINTASRLYYCQDANQNTTALVTQAGAVAERYLYDASGKPTVLSATWTSQAATVNNNEILFAGYRRDPETQLYHVRNRSYHFTLGRWLQRDPLKYQDGSNLYEYVKSRPTALLDPKGLSGISYWEEWWCIENWGCCASAFSATREWMALSKKLFAGAKDNTVENAVYHCTWMCYVASQPCCGVSEALLLGLAHERGTENNPALDRAMDLHNNRAGTKLAKRGKSLNSCLTDCKAAAKGYRLFWWLPEPRQPGRDGLPGDFPGFTVDENGNLQSGSYGDSSSTPQRGVTAPGNSSP